MNFFALGAYLLGDNDEPIGCSCNVDNSNCDEKQGNIIRAVVLDISLGLIMFVSVCAGVLARKDKDNCLLTDRDSSGGGGYTKLNN